MKKLRLPIFIIFILAFIAGCSTLKMSPKAFNLKVSGGWDGVKYCTGGTSVYYSSPRFEIKNIPTNTKYLRFHLYHSDAGYDHGTDDIVYQGGSVVPAAAFEYLGPCPNRSRLPGYYTWTVTALDAQKEIGLGRGKLKLTFPIE